MQPPTRQVLPAEAELHRFLRRALARLRWATLAVLLILVIVKPMASSIGLPTWLLVLAFAGYNLVIERVRLRNPRPELRSFALVASLDLPVAGLLYFLAGEAGGPLFILFFLAVDSAAASMSLRATVIYTGVAAAVAAGIELVLLMLAPSAVNLRDLGIRLVTLGLVASGMAILTQRLVLQWEVVRAMRDEASRLAELDRLRTGFLSTVSHDLRTPLTAARAGLGMLQTTVADRLRADERDLLGNVHRNVERLSMLIDDLLAFNQLEAGALHLDREVIDLRSVVTDAVAAVGTLLQERRQRLDVDLPEPLPVNGDPRRLGQVVVNLLANAHRHTPVGTHIAIRGEAGPTEVGLSVSDNGPGIPADQQAAIFRRFYRLGAVEGASGLGLAIAREVLELHGGRLWVESAPGQGATFHIRLPRA